jgi:DNA-binding SARP family transcriptional activator
MRFQLLGPLRIVDGDSVMTISAPKVETLLATLVIRANQVVSADELIDEVWGGHPPKRGRDALHVYISQLRKRFLGNSLRTHGQSYQLHIDPVDIDVTELRAAYEQGQSMRATDPRAALGHYTRAARLFRGPVLGGICNGHVVGGFARWVEEIRLACLESVATCSLQVGRHRELIGDLARWVDEYPMHEVFREHLMLALHRAGRRADALDVFQSGRRVLRDELGLEPRESMRRLQTAILNADLDCSLAS